MLRVTHNSDGQELWEVLSEDYSYSDSESPVPKAHKHRCRDKITMLQDLNWIEVFELLKEEYGYSESD
jgi:hypothetical protein